MFNLDDLEVKLRANDPHTVLLFLFGLSGVLTFPLLFFVSAPYGKLYREVRCTEGPRSDPRYQQPLLCVPSRLPSP